jgi:hypothetical protein
MVSQRRKDNEREQRISEEIKPVFDQPGIEPEVINPVEPLRDIDELCRRGSL